MSLQGVSRFITDEREHLRQLSDKLNATISGGGNNTGDLTLTANASSTTLTDARIGLTCVIELMPKSLNAVKAKSMIYFGTPKAGSVVIYHPNDAQTDKTFRYAITGS